MKINLEELFEERWNSGWSFEGGSIWTSWNSVTDEMVNAAVSSGKQEFAVILVPELLKRVKCECKFPSLKPFFVTGIYDLWQLDRYNKKKDFSRVSIFRYSLITFSKNKPQKIRICSAPKYLTNNKVKWNQRLEKCKEYYKELEIYINTSVVPDTLKSLVNKISYKDYRDEIFDAIFYTNRILNFYKNSIRKKKHVPLSDLVKIIDPRRTEINDFEKWAKHIDDKLEDASYPLNNTHLKPWKGFFPLKKDDIVVSRDGAAYLITEDSKTALTTSSHAILRLKSTMVTPEYLFLYMNSRVVKDILKAELAQELIIHTNWNDLSKISVILPDRNIPMALDPKQSQEYRDRFNREYRPYLVTGKENEIVDIQNELILQEDMEGVNLVSDPDANDRILAYLRELNIGISHGIYIGAGMLIGSVLEAFLTGWLEDKEDADYFRDPFRYAIIHGRKRKLELSFSEAVDKVLQLLEKAKVDEKTIKLIGEKLKNILRIRNNNVHTRVYLKNPIEMTKPVCESTLNDLETIIRLRYRNFQMDSFMKKIAME